MKEAAPVSNIRIGGMLMGYYIVCPRKAWLSMRGLWMEQESETVAIGRLIDETSYGREKKNIDLETTAPDGTRLVGRLDFADLREGVLHETKKSRAAEDAHRWQVRFYLWLLKLRGLRYLLPEHGYLLPGRRYKLLRRWYTRRCHGYGLHPCRTSFRSGTPCRHLHIRLSPA